MKIDVIGEKNKKMQYGLANMHNYLLKFLDNKIAQSSFLDDIIQVEKRIFLWYDTENRWKEKNLKTKQQQ